MGGATGKTVWEGEVTTGIIGAIIGGREVMGGIIGATIGERGVKIEFQERSEDKEVDIGTNFITI